MAVKAKAKAAQAASQHLDKPKVKRPGVVSKCKTSKLKGSKLYKKLSRGQGDHR